MLFCHLGPLGLLCYTRAMSKKRPTMFVSAVKQEKHALKSPGVERVIGLPANVLAQAEKLFLQGMTVSEVAARIGLEDPTALYEHLRSETRLLRERNVRYELDMDLVKYKVLEAMTRTLDSENERNRMMAAKTLMDYMMPKREKADGMVVINFGMEPPRMPDAPTYVYMDAEGTVGDE